MVRQGCFLDTVYRNQLYLAWKAGDSPAIAHEKVFQGNLELYASQSVHDRFNWFNKHEQEDIDKYLSASNTRKGRAGRKRKYTQVHDAEISRIVESDPRKRLRQIDHEFL